MLNKWFATAENLTLYTKEGSDLFEKRFDEILESVPMILSADFSFNFADDRNMPVIDFFQWCIVFNYMSNDRKLSAAKYKTTIDAVFTWYFHEFQSNIFVLYCSYHKSNISFLENKGMIENANNLNIVGINDDNNNANNTNNA